MDRHELKNRIEYIVVCVSEFAKRFNLTNQQAYAYLRRFTELTSSTIVMRLNIPNLLIVLLTICRCFAIKREVVFHDKVTSWFIHGH